MLEIEVTMYKLYRENDYQIMYYKFFSLHEYANFLTSELSNPKFSGYSSNEGDYAFCKTKTFEEAINLCTYGYYEDYKQFISLKIRLDRFLTLATKKSKAFNDYVGFAPNVKAYLEGNPLAMINKKKERYQKITIWFNSSCSADCTKEQIYVRGAITLSLIELLEKLGYSVDLHLIELSHNGKQFHFSDFLLKEEGERLNPGKLFFPMCHSSWIRRLNFRLIEVTPDVTDDWLNYGIPCSYNQTKEIVKPQDKDIIIPTIEELGIKGFDLLEDTKHVLDYIDQQGSGEFKIKEKVKVKSYDHTYNYMGSSYSDDDYYSDDDEELPF